MDRCSTTIRCGVPPGASGPRRGAWCVVRFAPHPPRARWHAPGVDPARPIRHPKKRPKNPPSDHPLAAQAPGALYRGRRLVPVRAKRQPYLHYLGSALYGRSTRVRCGVPPTAGVPRRGRLVDGCLVTSPPLMRGR